MPRKLCLHQLRLALVSKRFVQIVEKVPAPQGDVEAPLQALIFDSVYDAYRGVILQVRVVNGMVSKNGRRDLNDV